MKIHKIPNQIIKGKLTPLNLSKVTGIALHHMAQDKWSVKDVEAYHVYSNKWIAIGYNYWIDFDGTIYEGRGLNVGAHIEGFNSTTIGIGFRGNFQSGTNIGLTKMTDEQFNAGIDLINWLKEKIPTIKKVGGHKDFAPSQCPGNTFPLAEMISGKRREVEEIMIYNYIDENMPEWAHAAVKWAVDNGIVKGTGEGLGLTDQDLKYITWLYRAIEKRG